MRNFNRDRDNRGNRFGGRSERVMHSAICDECGQDCELPFKPTAGKPVYCSDCFKDKGGNRQNNDRYNNRGGDGDNRGNNQPLNNQLNALNAKLDKILELLTSNASQASKSKKEIVEKKKVLIKKDEHKKKSTKKAEVKKPKAKKKK